MIKNTHILCPERLRHVPRQFSWIDHRLVRHRHIQGPSPSALSLYLFLCTVSDARGLSYYSDGAAGSLLRLEVGKIREARGELMQAGLIAYRQPFYQVLSLEPETPGVLASAPAVPPAREGGMRAVGDVVARRGNDGRYIRDKRWGYVGGGRGGGGDIRFRSGE